MKDYEMSYCLHHPASFSACCILPVVSEVGRLSTSVVLLMPSIDGTCHVHRSGIDHVYISQVFGDLFVRLFWGFLVVVLLLKQLNVRSMLEKLYLLRHMVTFIWHKNNFMAHNLCMLVDSHILLFPAVN